MSCSPALCVALSGLSMAAGCASRRAELELREWDRGIAVVSERQADMAMYLWFYEWHMFDAVREGQHTPGGYEQFARQVSKDGKSASLVADTMRLDAEVAKGGVDLLLTITNNSGHDWPELAGIIPCFNSGPKDSPNAQMANTNTYFMGAEGLDRQQAREIHFNERLRPLIDRESDDGQYVFSHKWPTSERNATAGLLIRESSDGQWVTGIAWERFLSAQGHNPWKCMHLCIRVGPLKQGDTRTVRSRIYLMRGDRDDCRRRYLQDSTRW